MNDHNNNHHNDTYYYQSNNDTDERTPLQPQSNTLSLPSPPQQQQQQQQQQDQDHVNHSSNKINSNHRNVSNGTIVTSNRSSSNHNNDDHTNRNNNSSNNSNSSSSNDGVIYSQQQQQQQPYNTTQQQNSCNNYNSIIIMSQSPPHQARDMSRYHNYYYDNYNNNNNDNNNIDQHQQQKKEEKNSTTTTAQSFLTTNSNDTGTSSTKMIHQQHQQQKSTKSNTTTTTTTTTTATGTKSLKHSSNRRCCCSVPGNVAILASMISIVLCILVFLSSVGIRYKNYHNNHHNNNNNNNSTNDDDNDDRFVHWKSQWSSTTTTSATESSSSTTTTTTSLILEQQQLYYQQYYDCTTGTSTNNNNNNNNIAAGSGSSGSSTGSTGSDNCRYRMNDYDTITTTMTTTTNLQPPPQPPQEHEHSIIPNQLPGLVGIYGIPIYANYMNHGQQVISSFGNPNNSGYIKIYPNDHYNNNNNFRTLIQIHTKQSLQQSSSVSVSSTSVSSIDTTSMSIRERIRTMFQTIWYWWNHSVNNNDRNEADKAATTTILIEPFRPFTSQFNDNVHDTTGNTTITTTGSTSTSNNNSNDNDDMQPQSNQHYYHRTMYIGNNAIQIQEMDFLHGIETNVTFFILPEEDFGALVKRTTITYMMNRPKTNNNDDKQQLLETNDGGTTNTRKYKKTDRLDDEATITISILDGLMNVMPASTSSDSGTKKGFVNNSSDDYIVVDSPNDDDEDDGLVNIGIRMPFYHFSPASIPKNVNNNDERVVASGHWCLSVIDGVPMTNVEDATSSSSSSNASPELVPIIYDPSLIFGDDTTLEARPIRLQQPGHTISDILHNKIQQQHQYQHGIIPSAFAALNDVTLKVGQSITITSYYGTADHISDVPVIAQRLLQPGWVQFKINRATELVQQITSSVEGQTSNPLWDGHVKQMLLNNILQNGVGVTQIVGEDNDDSKLRCTDEDERLKVLHLFSSSSQSNDDKNSFDVGPSTFFSNGSGNFRDVVQNRRNDVFLNPRIGSFNVKTFLSFIQADGYEPSEIESILFRIDSIDDCIDIATQAVGAADGHRAQRTALANILHSGLFRPGQLFYDIMQQNIDLVISRQEFIDIVTAVARAYPSANFVSGFWADQWTYYMDIVNTYLSIYPDWEKRIFFEEQLPYFSSPVSVKPRSQKYLLLQKDDNEKRYIRQLNCTSVDKSEKRKQSVTNMDWDFYKTHWQHDEDGSIFKSTPMEKLFLLVTLKFAARDPYGVGILYEGGKPGWNDANNGLVDLIGSGTPELYELCVLMKFVKTTIKKYDIDINVPIELNRLVGSINTALDVLQQSEYVDGNNLYPKVPEPLFNYWDTVTTALEEYRRQVERTFIGKTHTLQFDDLDVFMKRCLVQIELGIERGLKFGTLGYGDDGSSAIPPTYFTYDVVDWTLTGESSISGHSFVMPLEMEIRTLPLFLEGPTRYLKTVATKDVTKALYDKIRTSSLRDINLLMYTVSASLIGQSSELGRVTTLPPGWLQNQSVWLQMSYKYYLELLRHGLYEEFFLEMESGGMLPYFDPKVYGHSLMDCTKFIVSSVYDDPSIRGRGYNANYNNNNSPSQQFSCGGATSELLSMWIHIMIGPQPFVLHDTTGELQLQLQPTIPLSWFYSTGPQDDATATLIVRYKLFGSIDITYHNLRRIDLYDIVPSRYVVTLRDGTVKDVDGPIIDDTDLADKIRRIAFVATLEVYF